MRLSVASAALAAAFLLAPVAAGHAPAWSQDFTITNQPAPAAAGSRRDVMQQLQAWWNVHSFYPQHASNNDEGGTVKLHLSIYPDGNIGKADVVGSSGSPSLDQAGAAVFHEGFVRPFPEHAPGMDVDVSLHYVLAHRHNQPVPAGYTSVPSKDPFTIANDPVKSPILETMLQRTCTGTIVSEGIRNHPWYGVRYYGAQMIFFRKPDGTPWVKFLEAGYTVLAPVVQIGKLVQWTGPAQRLGGGALRFVQYTGWPDGDDKISGSINIDNTYVTNPTNINNGGTFDFTCATETVPAITWSSWSVTPGQSPPGDPP